MHAEWNNTTHPRSTPNPGPGLLFALLLCLLLTAPALAHECPPCPGEEEEPTPEGEVQVFFGYLHAHTGYSDGKGTPLQAYLQARDLAGLDYLAITPHNHGQAGRIASEPELYNGPGSESLISTANALTEDGTFVALYGQEYSSISRGNHVNVLDAPTVIRTSNGEYDELLEDYLPNNLDSFGNQPLLVLNHPDSGPRSKQYGRDDFGTEAEWIRQMDARASVINLINGPSHSAGPAVVPGPDEDSFRFFLNLGFHLAPSIDQDNHERTWGTIHDGRTAVVAPRLTKKAVLDALRARHLYATTDRNLRVVCRVDEGLCGDIFQTTGTPQDVQVTLEVADDDEPNADYQVSVFTDVIGDSWLDPEDPVEEVLFDGDGQVSLPPLRYTGDREYFLIKIRQFTASDDTGADADTVWLAPFWFEPEAAPTPIEPAGLAVASMPTVAHSASEVFHAEDCPQAAAITGEARLTGADAVAGRLPHRECTGMHEAMP